MVTLGLRLRDRTVRKQFMPQTEVTLTGDLTHRLFSWAMHKIMKMAQDLGYILLYTCYLICVL